MLKTEIQVHISSFDYVQLFVSHLHNCTLLIFSLVQTKKLYYLLPHYDQKLPKNFQKVMVIIFQVQFSFCQTLNAIQTNINV